MTNAAVSILTPEDIRHIRPTQLSALTGISPANFPRWDQGGRISERSLERIAEGLWISKQEVLEGFELRRMDTIRARAAQEKAERLIAIIYRTQTPA